MPSEWVEWHKRYDEDPSLTQRLKVVQDLLFEVLDRSPAGPVRAVSMCAGDGRDLLGVLATHPRRNDVRARLVELEPELVERGRAATVRQAIPGVEFQLGDAGTTDAYAGAVPAHLVMVCGVWGNVRDDDIQTTIGHLPELCAPGATVVWTRGRFEPDLTPAIRRWFDEAGFDELAFVTIPNSTMSVGAHRLRVAPRPFRPHVRLFTFLPKEDRPSTRARAKRGPTPPERSA